jgi:hypothetical protein
MIATFRRPPDPFLESGPSENAGPPGLLGGVSDGARRWSRVAAQTGGLCLEAEEKCGQEKFVFRPKTVVKYESGEAE